MNQCGWRRGTAATNSPYSRRASEYCRERLDAYRESGIALPIISPFSRGPGGKERVMAAIRACAP